MISEPRCILCPPEGIPILRLHQHTNGAVAKTYYQKMVGAVLASYYQSDMSVSQQDAEQPLIGRVDGKLADQLNLSGGMTEQQFHDLIDGNAVDPVTGERLRKRQNRDGTNRVGVDITFDTGGKSLSAYYARTQDPLCG